MKPFYHHLCFTALLLTASASAFTAGESITLFDFTNGDAQGWFGNPGVSNFTASEEGLGFDCTGHDPWIEGPVVENMPLGKKLILTIRIRSNGDPSGEVFYGGPQFSGQRLRRFSFNNDGEWQEVEVILPPQEEGSRLRIDPTMRDAKVGVAWIKARVLEPVDETVFRAPLPMTTPPAHTIDKGMIKLHHDGQRWNGFSLEVDEITMAQGHTTACIGYLHEGTPKYLQTDTATIRCAPERDGFKVQTLLIDEGGAEWLLTRYYKAPPLSGSPIEITTEIAVSKPRQVFHLPWLTLFSGLNSFGTEKTQALLPGVEYLADEPSSSEADLRGDQAIRRMVDDFRLCYPMMALNHQGRYIALSWNREDFPAPLFDSPDRIFNSGAHVMGLWQPGVTEGRLENALHAHEPLRMNAGQPYTLQATLMAGKGDTVVDAMKHYIGLKGIPLAPVWQDGLQSAIDLMAYGWLDSPSKVGPRWRHAVVPDESHFPPQLSADAILYMRWLARYTDRPDLAARLRQAADEALAALPPNNLSGHWVSHVRRPLAPLVLHDAQAFTGGQRAAAFNQLKLFREDGTIQYRMGSKGVDYAETHFADHANAHTANTLEHILQIAAFSGDATLTAEALRLLDCFTERYANTVPRGAQVWEMPLHTPDILGAGKIIHCYVLGYLLTGDDTYLEQARYWAWTGLAMVYLDPPAAGDVGPYATIGVIGATNWIAPNWIGLPVQWCGLVYAAALEDLAHNDPVEGAFWHTIAQRITLAGLQMSDDPRPDRAGLLPDFFHLYEQRGDGPAINPGTVQFRLPEAFGQGKFYDVARLPSGHLVHAPGEISQVQEIKNQTSLHIQAWPETPYLIRLTKVNATFDDITWSSSDGQLLQQHYNPEYRTLDLELTGSGTLTLPLRSTPPLGLVINEDNSHFFSSRTAADMTMDGVNAFIDQYADTQVSHLFLNANAMRASFKSRARDAIWDVGNQEIPSEGSGRRWIDNARLLHERGIDPYAVWIERSREKGISPWISMRMNDVHDVPNLKSFMHSTFWVEHPEYWRIPGGGGWTDRALDYAIPEVRQHAMDMVRELLKRYDPDGLELDWMRFGWHFAPGKEVEGAEILTQFLRDVRQLINVWSMERGHPILLGVRVPAHPDAAKGLGMDAVRWAKEGLIDRLTPCPFWTTSDFDIPVELWREQLGDAAANIILAPGLEHNVRAYPGAKPIANDLASTRGFAASAWHRGADQIYLFNYMDSETRPVSAKDYRILVEQGLGAAHVATQPRRHIQCFRDTVPAGFNAGIKLPADTANGASFTLNIGPKPGTGTATFIAGIAENEGSANAQFDVTVNGVSCPYQADSDTPNAYPGTVRALHFAIPLTALHPGSNEIQITQPSQQTAQKMVWAEIMIAP